MTKKKLDWWFELALSQTEVRRLAKQANVTFKFDKNRSALVFTNCSEDEGFRRLDNVIRELFLIGLRETEKNNQ